MEKSDETEVAQNVSLVWAFFDAELVYVVDHARAHDLRLGEIVVAQTPASLFLGHNN